MFINKKLLNTDEREWIFILDEIYISSQFLWQNQAGIFCNILKFQLDIPVVKMRSITEHQLVLQTPIVFPHLVVAPLS